MLAPSGALSMPCPAARAIPAPMSTAAARSWAAEGAAIARETRAASAQERSAVNASVLQ